MDNKGRKDMEFHIHQYVCIFIHISESGIVVSSFQEIIWILAFQSHGNTVIPDPCFLSDSD